jgi:hypothetical protein
MYLEQPASTSRAMQRIGSVISAFQAATALGVAFGPRITMAGEGKTECSRMKTKIEMPIRITMDVPMRRIR